MGMFDDVVCKMPLPDFPADVDDPGFQTKTLDNPYLRKYTITSEGRLVQTDLPEPQDMDYHGVLNFYMMGALRTWYEYNAKFTDGQCVSIERVVEST